MTLESKENCPRNTKTVQNSLGFMPEVKPLHKPHGDLVLCALNNIIQLFIFSSQKTEYWTEADFKAVGCSW